MLTILHAADFHLDSPFSALSPALATKRREEQRTLLQRLADCAVQRKADLVLLAGDLFDTGTIYRETAQALRECLGQMPCPVLIAAGNHDYYCDSSPYATLDWPENVHIFTGEQIEAVEFPALRCTVYGSAFTAPHRADFPLTAFQAQGREGWINLMCLHGEVGTEGDYAPITKREIANSGLDYLALGHVHQYSDLQREGDTFWAYSGCPEGRGFDELGEKGAICVQFESGKISHAFIPLAHRRYQRINVTLAPNTAPLETIKAALPADTQHDIYRITLCGECDAPDLQGLEKELAGRFFALQLKDETRLPQDLWARRQEDTLTGLFLRAMWEKCQAEPDNHTLQLAARFGLAALENGEDICP